MTILETMKRNPADCGPLLEAAQRFVALGDDPGIFMTTIGTHDEKPHVKLGCQNLHHAQAVYRAIVDIVEATRDMR